MRVTGRIKGAAAAVVVTGIVVAASLQDVPGEGSDAAGADGWVRDEPTGSAPRVAGADPSRKLVDEQFAAVLGPSGNRGSAALSGEDSQEEFGDADGCELNWGIPAIVGLEEQREIVIGLIARGWTITAHRDRPAGWVMTNGSWELVLINVRSRRGPSYVSLEALRHDATCGGEPAGADPGDANDA